MGMSNVWKSLSVASGLLLLLTYLLIQGRSPDLALRARMQEAMQTLQLHDTELTRDVLLARAGLLPHYDSLVRTRQSLSRTLGTLRAESATVPGPAGRDMGRRVEALRMEEIFTLLGLRPGALGSAAQRPALIAGSAAGV